MAMSLLKDHHSVEETFEFTNQLTLCAMVLRHGAPENLNLHRTQCPETRTLIIAAVTHIYGTTFPWE